MLVLPSELSVTFLDTTGNAVPGVLASLYLYWHGLDYYPFPFGLSDAAGLVRASAPEVERHFHEQQQLFPMDLKVPLEECDEEAGISIIGGAEFEEHRRSLRPGWTEPRWMEQWRSARNAQFATSTTKVSLTSTLGRSLSITLQPRWPVGRGGRAT